MNSINMKVVCQLWMSYRYIELYAFIYIMFECIKQHVDMINVYMIIILLWLIFDKKKYYKFLIVNFIE